MSKKGTTSTATLPQTKPHTDTTDGTEAIQPEARRFCVCEGDTVLMRVSDSSWRPLLVVSIKGQDVSGMLTIDHALDQDSPLVQQHWFYKPDPVTCHKFERDVRPGQANGQYLTRDEYLERNT